jgi:hypothetical protein
MSCLQLRNEFNRVTEFGPDWSARRRISFAEDSSTRTLT